MEAIGIESLSFAQMMPEFNGLWDYKLSFDRFVTYIDFMAKFVDIHKTQPKQMQILKLVLLLVRSFVGNDLINRGES